MATYIDDQGFLTQDYTMDNSDVAAAMAASGGSVSRRGIPMMGMGTGAAMPGDAGSSWDPLDRLGASQAAVNQTAQAATMGLPSNVTSQSFTASTPSVGRSLPVPVGGIAPTMPGMNPQAAAASQDQAANNAIELAKLAPNDLAHRAMFSPGGTDLYNALVAAGHLGNAGQLTNPYDPTSLSSGLLDPNGKALPGNQINKDMISDPRFQQLMKQDQIAGTNYASTFYQNMNGRSLAQDQAANTALMTSASANRLKDAAELQKTLTEAPSDMTVNGVKIHKGDLVTQQVVPGLLPGQDQISILPLTSYQRELANVMPDMTTDAKGNTVQATDQYGRPSYSARGKSLIQQATGLPSAADLQYGQSLQARKLAANRSAAAAQPPSVPQSTQTGVAPAGKATTLNPLDATGLIYDNATTTLGNLANWFTGGTDAPYTTPQQRVAEINNKSVNAATTWGNSQRGGAVASPKLLAEQMAAQAPVKKAGLQFDPYLFQNDDNYLPPKSN